MNGNNPIAVAVVLPNDAGEARLVAMSTVGNEVVSFSDDGAFAFDMPADGELWALVTQGMGATVVRIGGRIAETTVSHVEVVEVPTAWRDRTYPVTLRATKVSGEWTFERTFGSPLPAWDGPTGAGLAGKAEQLGLSASVLYLGWGAFVLALALTAAVRGAVLRASRAR
jgi:hypothetical protein